MENAKIIDLKRSFMQSFTSIGPFLDIAAIFASITIISLFMMPLVVLSAFLISYTTIYGVYYISRRHSSNGGYYSFAGKIFGVNAGLITGFFYIFYSSLVLPNISLFVATFIYSSLSSIGFNFLYSQDLYAILFSLSAIILVSRGLKLSSFYVLMFGLIEMAAMLFYIAFFFSNSPGYTNPLQNFDVESFFTGVMFGMVIFAGSGSSIFISENTRRSGKLVPIAVMTSFTISGLILTLAAFAMDDYLGPTGLTLYSQTGGAYILTMLMDQNFSLYAIFLSITVLSAFNLSISYLRAFISALDRMRKDKIIPSWKTKFQDSSIDLFILFLVTLIIVIISNFIGFFNMFLTILTCVALSYILVHIITAIAVMKDSNYMIRKPSFIISLISMIFLSLVLYFEITYDPNLYSNIITFAMVLLSTLIVFAVNIYRRKYLTKVTFGGKISQLQ